MKNLWSKLNKKCIYLHTNYNYPKCPLHNFLLEDNDIQTLQNKQLIMTLID